MTPKVILVSADDWQGFFSSQAHLLCFGAERGADYDSLDYALLVIDEETDKPVGYVTCRDINKDMVQWKWGGTFENIAKTVNVVKAYRAGLEVMKAKGYESIFTLIKNTNLPSLKLAMGHGFRIIGAKTIKSEIMVELLLDL